MFSKDIKCEGELMYTYTQIQKEKGFFSIATSIAELNAQCLRKSIVVGYII